ncbi:PEP-CTERM sorting domain-containing protein [Duganella sp. FT135W]|uniref:PEP-CTERM sorting domain-containing protein n=1 Tax=Duganella flavida TaxID=2692175 RepID=A0A6L8K8V7_9BURK|nr:PEP-CTERM sorting domain-containing protein [Duganella flavida]MYM23949.1 PEP-CTERM sorting domain-containing protein [Duganella flavida]
MKTTVQSMLSVFACAAACAALPARADIITFDNADLAHVAVRPTIFTTQGFVFTALDYLGLSGGVDSYNNGTTVLTFAPHDIVSGTETNAVTFRRQDAGLFNLNSLEFSPGAYAGTSVKLGIKGVFANGSTVSGVVQTSNVGFLTPVDFVGWTGLASVVLTGNLLSQSYVQIDNINVSAVPEPASYAMLFAGLGLLGFVARRTRSA